MTVRIPAPGCVHHDISELIPTLGGNTLAFVFGTDEAGAAFRTTLLEAAPVLLLDEDGTGMTDLMASLLLQLCVTNDAERLRIALLEPRQELTQLFGSHPHTRFVATNEEKVATSLQFLAEELQNRERDRVPAPPWLVFLEENQSLWQEQGLWPLFSSLVMRGAASGMFLLLASRRTEQWNEALRKPFRSTLTFARSPSYTPQPVALDQTLMDASQSVVMDHTLVGSYLPGTDRGHFMLQHTAEHAQTKLLAPPTFSARSILLLLTGSDAGADLVEARRAS